MGIFSTNFVPSNLILAPKIFGSMCQLWYFKRHNPNLVNAGQVVESMPLEHLVLEVTMIQGKNFYMVAYGPSIYEVGTV